MGITDGVLAADDAFLTPVRCFRVSAVFLPVRRRVRVLRAFLVAAERGRVAAVLAVLEDLIDRILPFPRVCPTSID
jgi:hypothetical protein